VTRQVQEVYRRATTLAAGLADATGVHPTDVRALRILDEMAGSPLTVGQLGARLRLSSGAVTELVDRLEAAGLARRERDTADRRRVVVSLGPKAREFGSEHLAPISAAIERAIAASDDRDLAAVQRFLEVLLDEQPPPAVS
jgi:DNA-binding MarR family transcriptional regulator